MVRATLLHDIGRAFDPTDSRPHALVSAEVLSQCGLPREAALAAHHSGATVECRARGFSDPSGRWPREDSPLPSLLTYIDMTTSPEGVVTTLESRGREIENRYGRESFQAKAYRSISAELAIGAELSREDTDRRLLVLDVGGVLLADPLAEIFDELAQRSDKSREAIVGFYGRELREPLWSGSVDEEEFWRLLLDFAGLPPEPSWWRRKTIRAMKPLPGAACLADWSRRVPVWLLSNHRTEWLEPALGQTGLGQFLARALVSDVTHRVKPDRAAFAEILEVSGLSASQGLFVDDQARNVQAAQAIGLAGLVADPSGDWLVTVNRWVQDHAASGRGID